MSSRVGKIKHTKTGKTVFVCTNTDGNTCGHQHVRKSAATNCLTRQPGGWFIRYYLPATNTNGRMEVQS